MSQKSITINLHIATLVGKIEICDCQPKKNSPQQVEVLLQSLTQAIVSAAASLSEDWIDTILSDQAPEQKP